MANTHMKRFSTSVVIRERYKLKPQGDTTFTPTGMGIMKKIGQLLVRMKSHQKTHTIAHRNGKW